MTSKTLPLFLSLGCGLILSAAAIAKPAKVELPAASPACTIKQRIGVTDIEVDYSRPGVKGREIFGGLVPYGEVWRTGANSATKLIVSTPVKMNGTEIPAGTYALFTIPGKDTWTIIINKGAEQWGAFKYNEKDDVARFKATPMAIDHGHETLMIEFDKVTDNTADLDLAWDKTEVPIKIEVSLDKVTSELDAVMSSSEKEKPYFQAANFYYNHGLDLNKAKEWVDAALAERPTYSVYHLKAKVLAKLGDKEGAIAAAKQSTELATKANDVGVIKANAELMSTLK